MTSKAKTCKSRFWKFLQRIFGLERHTHYFDVPKAIREASHDSSNEVMKLKAELNFHKKNNDVLRDLVNRMQQTLAERESVRRTQAGDLQ